MRNHLLIRRYLSAICLLSVLAALPVETHAQRPRYDIVITGGRVIDGSGTGWYDADIAIDDGKIAAIGRIESKYGREQIDAKGLIVAPGFIDMMGQTATPMLRRPETALNLLTQGITTINAGEGTSAAPLNETMLLGIVAMRTGKPIEYDGAAGRVTNSEEANALLGRTYRNGWALTA